MPMAVAQRYARALAELAAPKNEYERVENDLANFAALYAESSELREVFDSPAVAPPQKGKVLEALLDRLDVADLTRRFLGVLLAHYRMNLLDEVRVAFTHILNESLGILEMKVVSAAPLSSEQQAGLAARFGELTGRKVQMEYAIDPSLIGGLRARMKSTIYDGTVRGYLDRLREQMGAP